MYNVPLQKPKLPNTMPRNANDLLPTNEVFAYDPCAKSWRNLKCNGSIFPPPNVGAAG